MGNADLRFDTAAFQKAIEDYRTVIDEMTAIKDELQEHLTDLKDNSWQSTAGAMFLEHYKGTWKENIETYTNFLLHLTETLEEVSGRYEALYERAQLLDIS